MSLEPGLAGERSPGGDLSPAAPLSPAGAPGQAGDPGLTGAPSPAADPAAPYARLAVVGLIRRAGKDAPGARWLLLERAAPVGGRQAPDGCWDPPGGRVERGEDLTQAVVREMLEETGLEVEVGGPCYAYLTHHKGERLLAVSMACRLRAEETRADDLRLESGVGGWLWKTAAEWEDLAVRGQTSWTALDVRRAVRLATEIWEVDAQ